MKCPVTVHGAGTAGLATALALHTRGHAVSIVERGKPRRTVAFEIVGEEFFSLATAVGALGLFDGLQRRRPIDAIATHWPGNEGFEAAASFRPTERRWAVERCELLTMLRRSVEARNIKIKHAREMRRPAERGGLLVDATGRAAAIGRRMGAVLLPIAEMIAITGRALTQRLEMPTLEAAPDGWWFAIGDLAEVSVTYFTDAAEAGHIFEVSDLAARLSATERLGRQITLDENQTLTRYSAGSSYLEPGAGPGWAAVGDALLTYDPLTSHGLTHAMRSAARLADACAMGAPLASYFLKEAGVDIARYRIRRQRLYLAGAEAFDRPFWLTRASLITPAPGRARSPPGSK